MDVRRRRIVHPIREANVSMKVASCKGIDNTKSSRSLHLYLFTLQKLHNFPNFQASWGQKSATSLPVFIVYSGFIRKLGRNGADMAAEMRVRW